MSPCAAGGTRAARSSPTVTLAFPHRCVNVRKEGRFSSRGSERDRAPRPADHSGRGAEAWRVLPAP